MDGSDWAAGQHGSARAQAAVQHAQPETGEQQTAPAVSINTGAQASPQASMPPQGMKLPMPKKGPQ